MALEDFNAKYYAQALNQVKTKLPLEILQLISRLAAEDFTFGFERDPSSKNDDKKECEICGKVVKFSFGGAVGYWKFYWANFYSNVVLSSGTHTFTYKLQMPELSDNCLVNLGFCDLQILHGVKSQKLSIGGAMGTIGWRGRDVNAWIQVAGIDWFKTGDIAKITINLDSYYLQLQVNNSVVRTVSFAALRRRGSRTNIFSSYSLLQVVPVFSDIKIPRYPDAGSSSANFS